MTPVLPSITCKEALLLRKLHPVDAHSMWRQPAINTGSTRLTERLTEEPADSWHTFSTAPQSLRLLLTLILLKSSTVASCCFAHTRHTQER
jgi:hypothetical protein